MSDHLVVEKSRTQQRIEVWLAFLLPPLVSVLCIRNGGPLALCAPLLVLLTYLGIAPVGGLFAARFGHGERVTREERLRRTIDSNRWPFLALMLFYCALLIDISLSACLPFFSQEDRPTMIAWFVPFTVVAGLLAGLAGAMRMRNLRRAPGDVAEPAQSPREWLIDYLPGAYLFWSVGITCGFLLAPHLPAPINSLAISGGLIVAVVAHMLFQGRRRRPPLLWHQFNFGWALLTGFLYTGVLFAALAYALATVLAPQDRAGAIILSVIGLVFGVLVLLTQWGLAKLNDVRPRD